MVSAVSSALEMTIDSLAERTGLHVNKLTAVVNSLSCAIANNLGKNGQNQLIPENPERFENSKTGEVDEVLTVYEDDKTLYQEQREIIAKTFLGTPSENDPILSAVIKGFSDSYNVDDKKLEQTVTDDVQNVFMLVFNKSISADH